MTIALDATPLTISTGGVARYTLELAVALARRFPEDEYWLLSDRPFAMRDSLLPNLHRNGQPGSGPRGVFERRWWLWGVHREMTRRGVDLFHGVDFSVPYLPFRPSVMTVHDLSPWLNTASMEQSWQPGAGRVRRRTAMLLRARVPAMVITPTEAIRRAVIDRFGFPAARVTAVPLAASEHFRPVSCAPPETPYFLFVGTLEPRKNIPRLIEAWRQVRTDGTREIHAIDLVIAGRRRSDFPVVVEEPGLRVAGAVPDEDLPALYSNALAVIYPSLYEGFGLPVLEAMQCGAIVVASRDPAIMEVAGDGAILIDAHDVRGLAEALAAIARSPEAFDSLRERALARAREFSWRRTAELTQEVYEAARRVFAK